MKKTNRQTIVHMTQHRKLKNKQHEHILKGTAEYWMSLGVFFGVYIFFH